MVVIDAGQHILQRKGVMENAVGGVPERQRQLRCGKLSEERKHQSCQCTFSGAGFAYQEEYKLRFTSGKFQKQHSEHTFV